LKTYIKENLENALTDKLFEIRNNGSNTSYTFSGKRLPAKKKFLSDDLFLVEATEPTNIIWENRHWTTKDYVYRTFIAFSFICFLLCVSFAIIFYSKIYAIVIDSKYPDVDCDYITEVYGSSDLEKWAYLEYVAYYNATEGEESLPFSGTLQCFCDDLTDTLGYGTDLF